MLDATAQAGLVGPGALPRGRSLDAFVTTAVWLGAGLIVAVFFWIVGDVFVHGVGGLSWSFLIDSPTHAGRGGGIGPIIVSTGLILTVCMAVSVPLGVGAGAWLAEFCPSTSLLGASVRRSLDMLAGVPSIVFGLFGNAFFCVYLGMGFSILSGGLTLACMVLPILIRSVEQGFGSVPGEHRRSAAALGMTRARTLAHVLLPAATPGLMAGLVLGIGRAMAETAALIFTSGYVDRMPQSLADSGRAMSVHIYDLSMNVAGGEPNAYTTALVLVASLLVINGATSAIGQRWLCGRSRG